ncbi:MAG TPA: hypothetical protein VI386_28900 [Candidatus Sulfotelmatobacter sp.]
MDTKKQTVPSTLDSALQLIVTRSSRVKIADPSSLHNSEVVIAGQRAGGRGDDDGAGGVGPTSSTQGL